MKKEDQNSIRKELAKNLVSTKSQIEGGFRGYYQETDYLDEVAEGIVLDSSTHGALDEDLNLLVPQKILDAVMEVVDPGDENAEAWRYVGLKERFSHLFGETGDTGTVEGFTREMYEAWQENIEKLVADSKEEVAQIKVTDRESDGGIDYREAVRNVFMSLLEADCPEASYSNKSIVGEVSTNLGDSTTSEIFLSVFNRIKDTPEFGFQTELLGGMWRIRDKFINVVASELSIDTDVMETIIDRVRKHPGLLVQVAPSIGRVITTYRTHGAKNAMLYLLSIGEWAQQDIDGVMELPWSLQRPDFYEYFEEKVMNYADNECGPNEKTTVSEAVFEKSPMLKKALERKEFGVDATKIPSGTGYVLPSYVYQKIFNEPAVVMKLIPCLERTFGHGEGKVAAAVLYVADLGLRAKLQGKTEQKQAD